LSWKERKRKTEREREREREKERFREREREFGGTKKVESEKMACKSKEWHNKA
jgi:hypothetical protein